MKRPKYALRGDNPELMSTVLKEEGSSISIVINLRMKNEQVDASLISNINGNIKLIPDTDSVFIVQVKDTNLHVYITKSHIPEDEKMRWNIITTTQPFSFDNSAVFDYTSAKMPFDESNFYSGCQLSLDNIKVVIWENI